MDDGADALRRYILAKSVMARSRKRPKSGRACDAGKRSSLCPRSRFEGIFFIAVFGADSCCGGMGKPGCAGRGCLWCPKCADMTITSCRNRLDIADSFLVST